MIAISDIFQASAWEYRAGRAVPPYGFTARLTVFTVGAMAFLVVFALALLPAAGRLADSWSSELARASAVRIPAPTAQLVEQPAAALKVLQATPGVISARILDESEERAIFEPWFGPDLPLESLPFPKLIAVIKNSQGYDAVGLRLRSQAEAPGAVLVDHIRWREPLVRAADCLRLLGYVAVFLIGATNAAKFTLAANSALAANRQVIEVLRLVGAEDSYIARDFVRRFTSRAFGGELVGMVLRNLAILISTDTSLQAIF